jgi:tetratricopeptide (TPR) repeat protein
MWIIFKIVPNGGGLGIFVLLLLVMGIVVGVKQCKEDDTMRPVYRDVLSASPPAMRWRNTSGAKHLEKGNYNKAIGEFTKSIKIFPSAEILSLRAAAYYGLGNLDSAIADWEAAVEMAPDNAALRQNLENTKKARGRK